jgi:hypothetical protein
MNNKNKEILKIYNDLNELIGHSLTAISEVHGKEVHMLFSEAFALMMSKLLNIVAPDITSEEIFEAMCDGHKGFREYAAEKFIEDLRNQVKVNINEAN